MQQLGNAASFPGIKFPAYLARITYMSRPRSTPPINDPAGIDWVVFIGIHSASCFSCVSLANMTKDMRHERPSARSYLALKLYYHRNLTSVTWQWVSKEVYDIHVTTNLPPHAYVRGTIVITHICINPVHLHINSEKKQKKLLASTKAELVVNVQSMHHI